MKRNYTTDFSKLKTPKDEETIHSREENHSSVGDHFWERMLPRSAAVLHRTTGVAASFMIFSVLIAESSNDSQVRCSTTCVADNCDSKCFLDEYGKYCGVGWTGCPGEKPCDDVDACCQIHDDCVGINGLTNIQCHEEFKRCIKKVHKSGNEGFSKVCPYDTTIPTMVQGMDIAILLSHMGTPKEEL